MSTPITIETSLNLGYFKLNGIDYPKGHFYLKYDNKEQSEAIRNFSLVNIYDNSELVASRGYSEVVGISSWLELLDLLNLHGVLNNSITPLDKVQSDLSGRQSLNTIFGDLITGIRKTSIGAQFQYGIEEGTSDSAIIGSGSISIDESLLVMSTGVDANGSARIESTETVRYVPGQETYCLFTLVFSSPQLNSYQRGGLFDDENGFFVSYEEDGKFYFTRRRDSIDTRQEIDLSEFERINGYAFNPTKGNIYRISYGYLGFAPISLEVVKPGGGFALLSKIEYPNNFEVTHTLQTFLPIRGEVVNNGNTSDIILKSGSLAAGITDGGVDDVAGRRFAFTLPAKKTTVAGDTVIVGFRNKNTFATKVNRVQALLLLISGSNDGTKVFKWKIYKNPVVTNTPTWSDINTNNSTLEYSEDILINFGTSEEIFLAWNTGRIDSFFEDVKDQELLLPPGGVAVFVTNSENAGEADLSIRWNELF